MAPSILSTNITSLAISRAFITKVTLLWIWFIYAKSLPMRNILNISISILTSLSVNQIFQYKKMAYWQLKRNIYKQKWCKPSPPRQTRANDSNPWSTEKQIEISAIVCLWNKHNYSYRTGNDNVNIKFHSSFLKVELLFNIALPTLMLTTNTNFKGMWNVTRACL